MNDSSVMMQADGSVFVLNAGNRRDWVKAFARHELVGKRSRALAAMHKGFRLPGLPSNVFAIHAHLMRSQFKAHLSKFNAGDLMLFLCGEAYIDAHLVLANVQFDARSACLSNLRTCIGEWN